MDDQRDVRPVIESGTFEFAVADAEAKRLDQM